jgi:PLD-like domain
MQTEAVFENIAERIQLEINKSKNTIFIAVAWFTNRNIFNQLVKKAEIGCTVSLIISNDHINQNSSINFDLLQIGKSKVYKIGNGDTELMHNKFCVIDHDTVITGSYNWSYKAETNFENVVITSGDSSLAEQFVTEFNNIRKMYYPNEIHTDIVFPLTKIIKRLEILKNYILLEDVDEVIKESTKLREYDYNSELLEIINNIQLKEYGDAIHKIENFITKNQQLTIWVDTEIAALKLETKVLENQLNAFDNEKIELEKLLSEFQHRHSSELGAIILDILHLRKIKFKEFKEKYEEAENDEKQYREQMDTEKDIIDLTDELKLELKQKFRKATVLCHPDKFANESHEIQNQAETIFKELNEANAKNDMARVSEILANLEKGILTTEFSNKLTDKDKLRATINKLRFKVQILEVDIISIKESETYQTIINIKDWDEYFTQIKEKLTRELADLKSEIS